MPPELKKPITSINEMTCENCVFSVITNMDNAEFALCYHVSPVMNFLKMESLEFCSEGQWLWFGKWLYEEHTSDSKEILHLCNYWELYTKFAREAGQKK